MTFATLHVRSSNRYTLATASVKGSVPLIHHRLYPPTNFTQATSSSLHHQGRGRGERERERERKRHFTFSQHNKCRQHTSHKLKLTHPSVQVQFSQNYSRAISIDSLSLSLSPILEISIQHLERIHF